jgi:transposase
VIAERAAFQEAQRTLDIDTVVWLDEAGMNLSMTTGYARAPSGQRAVEYRPSTRTKKTSIIGAMTRQGMVALGTVEGSFNGPRFRDWITTTLLPLLAPGTAIIWDNIPFHHSIEVRAAVEAAGCRLVKMPPYSPDLNPIEECWSKLKYLVRRAKARTQEALASALETAVTLLSPSDFDGWTRHAGYGHV